MGQIQGAKYLNSFRLSDQRLGMGSLKGPPIDIWLLEDIFIIFLKHLSLFGCQGLESKSPLHEKL